MPSYINLLNWTDKGIQSFQKSLERAEKAEEAGQKLGVAFEHIYWTPGEYDVVATTEAPDDETATAFMLMVGKQGYVRSRTLRAFDKVEMQKIIAKAPTSTY
jgi:uncharacterized protein with GYD domain